VYSKASLHITSELQWALWWWDLTKKVTV